MHHELKPYPAYKDSGVPWLEGLPATWRVLRGKIVFRVVDVRSETGQEELLTVSSADGVVPRSQKTVTMFKAESYIGHKLCWPGDLVINSLWAWMQGLGFAKHHGVVSSAYSVYRARPAFSTYARYFDYALRSAAYKWELQTRSKGVWLSRLQLSDAAFLDMPILVPLVNEESAIVRFLAHADRRINGLIHAKRRLIELLNEQKQVITHRAVTRGLDPNVRLKPSGISWLGDVPEDWEVAQLGRFLRTVEQGWSPVAAEGDADEDQWAVVTLSAVKKGSFYPGENKPLPRSMDVPRGLELQQGDFLLTRSNTRSLVGDVCVVEHTRPKLMLCDLIYRLRLDTRHLHPRFLMYQVLSPCGRVQIETDARGSSSTMVKLSQGHIKRWSILQPPPDVQENIAAHLDGVSSEIASLIHRAHREIDLLREYRTRLIADVVTGKVDVRGVELPTFHEAQALEEIDTAEQIEADEMVDTEEAADGDE